MFERFSDGARQAVKLATEEALRCGATEVGTEHLLAALANEASGTAAIVLHRLGVDQDKVREQIEKRTGRPLAPPRRRKLLEFVGGRRLPQTENFRAAVIASMLAARNLGKNIIDSERLLLAILEVGGTHTEEILAPLGVTADDVRRELARLLCDWKPAVDSL